MKYTNLNWRSCWRQWLDGIPALAFIRDRRAAMSRFGALVAVLILATTVVLLGIVIAPPVRTEMMKKFHLRSRSYGLWCVLQIIPSMYNFANEVWVSATPLTWSQLEKGEEIPNTAHVWTNHYPIQVLTYWERQLYFRGNGLTYVYLRSRYRESTLYSALRVVARAGHGMRCEYLPFDQE